ncbi:signal peptidase II [Segnochrobactrum spirostomi]|uniref:Lipoprotein signal peptidase n=1 Tax=Segnochrobactrum spirostomi TaxID=2608987 RepID=A0A6A7Y2S6_9HYPH|nr:signal peptidase II [Segnochrobactrum spirostomi]MQT13046.1 signal peptidase II [Segnochrobactrum spirostomi]
MSAQPTPKGGGPSRAAVRFGATLGWSVALLVLVVDQATKLALLRVYGLETAGAFRLAPFLDIVLVWNRGISYGMLQQDAAYGRWFLVAISLVAAVALGWWLGRTASRFTALALGLIIGGAVGNGIDRIAYGAVVDFVHFHIGTFSWYVFNVADVAIVVGAAALVIESVIGGRRTRPADGDVKR